MDQQVRDAIQDIKAVNRSTLKRLNEITETGDSSHCRCSDALARLTEELTHLNDRVDKLRLLESYTGPQESEFERRFSCIQSQLDELHKSVKAISAMDTKPEDVNSVQRDAGVGANGNASPSGAETEVTDSGNVNKNNNEATVSHDKISTVTEAASAQETPHSVPVESHQLQHQETKSKPNISTRTKNKNGPAAKPVSTTKDWEHSRVENNENDGRKVASSAFDRNAESTKISNSTSVGHTQSESAPFKPAQRVFKPNFVVSPNRSQTSTQNTRRSTLSNIARPFSSDTKVIRQTEKAYLFGDEDAWKSMAQTALNRAQQTCGHIDCVISVLCLDISESMASGNAWNQVREFANDFLEGLTESKENNPILKDEYVAVATFGHRTELKLLLTKNYDEVRQELDGLHLGGPSPLFGGLMMALAGAMSSRNASITISPKIIVLTDGRPTELMLNAGPDIADKSKMDHTMAHLVAAVEELSNRGHSLFFVGVGDYEKNFTENMTAVLESKKTYTYKEGRRLARRHYLGTQTAISGLSFLLPFGNRPSSSEDAEDMDDIRDEAARKVGGNNYRDSNDPNLPCVGSRVRRGPDWMWNIQDGGGPGTVVGHSVPAQVRVTWDLNEETNIYRYGLLGYDVLPVDEPRLLNHGETIAVGCTVKPGRDSTSQDVKPWNIGVVLRLQNAKALVKWDNGKRGNYSYGLDGKTEVEVCSSTSFRGKGYTLDGISYGENEMNFNDSNSNRGNNKSATTPSNKKHKNKNK